LVDKFGRSASLSKITEHDDCLGTSGADFGGHLFATLAIVQCMNQHPYSRLGQSECGRRPYSAAGTGDQH
jgi:hypothetical protein